MLSVRSKAGRRRKHKVDNKEKRESRSTTPTTFEQKNSQGTGKKEKTEKKRWRQKRNERRRKAREFERNGHHIDSLRSGVFFLSSFLESQLSLGKKRPSPRNWSTPTHTHTHFPYLDERSDSLCGDSRNRVLQSREESAEHGREKTRRRTRDKNIQQRKRATIHHKKNDDKTKSTSRDGRNRSSRARIRVLNRKKRKRTNESDRHMGKSGNQSEKKSNRNDGRTTSTSRDGRNTIFKSGDQSVWLEREIERSQGDRDTGKS